MMQSFVSALEDLMQSIYDLVSSFADRVAELIRRLGDYRNHSQTIDAYDEIGGDTLAGFYHRNCGKLMPKQRGFICQNCGHSFTAGIDVARKT